MSYKSKIIELINERFEKIAEIKRNFTINLKKRHQSGEIVICLFGAGFLGREFYTKFLDMGIKIDFFCDNDANKWGNYVVDNIKCISLDNLVKLCSEKEVLVVLSLGKVDEVYNQLQLLGIKNLIKHPFNLISDKQNNWMSQKKEDVISGVENMFDLLDDQFSLKVSYSLIKSFFLDNNELNEFSYNDICTKDIYGPKDIVSLKKGECIVDAGSYNGDTLKFFIEDKNFSDFDQYYCFELSLKNTIKLKERVLKYPLEIRDKITIFNKALYNKSGEIFYSEFDLSTSLSNDDFGNKGECTTLDEALNNKKVSYIKMDIEGCEIEALEGAAKIIRINKPTCAISVYHKATDIWEIPLLLKSLVPDYKIFIRHHEEIQSETVCYAVYCK